VRHNDENVSLLSVQFFQELSDDGATVSVEIARRLIG
jgi:hypothetical protein